MEEIEDIIFNLTENIDVEQTEAKIHEYEMTNKRNIAINMARKEEERKSMFKERMENDIKLREENKQYYDVDMDLEDESEAEKEEDTEYAKMAKARESSEALKKTINPIFFMHKIRSLKIPKPVKDKKSAIRNCRPDKVKIASGFNPDWVQQRCLHEIRFCLAE